ncbi:uncharacterized protein [Rutidosis leptorrhynchoides]|uniref:uncharacterized protein n=1 Tax=Rutidosis leptorrhynchoides TaxID=125765 RepID=UPI003A99F1C1
MKKAVEHNVIKGVEVGDDKIIVSHLQYADDTIFLEEWKKRNASNLMKLLIELIYRLKVNFSKSCLFGFGVSNSSTEEMAGFMRCSIGSFPFTYLGIPIGCRVNKLKD